LVFAINRLSKKAEARHATTRQPREAGAESLAVTAPSFKASPRSFGVSLLSLEALIVERRDGGTGDWVTEDESTDVTAMQRREDPR